MTYNLLEYFFDELIFFCFKLLKLERWPSGRRRTLGKRVFRYRGIEGSNPFLSANLNYRWEGIAPIKPQTWLAKLVASKTISFSGF